MTWFRRRANFVIDFVIASFLGTVCTNTCTSIVRLYRERSIVPFELTNLVLSLLSSAHLVGQLAGAAAIPYLTKKHGNRRTIIIFGALSLAIVLLTYAPVHWAFWMTLRLLIGVTQQVVIGTATVYLNSISPPGNKSALTTLFELFISCGVLITLLTMLTIGDKAAFWWVSLLYCTLITLLIPVLAYLVRPVQQRGPDYSMQVDLLALEGGHSAPADDLPAARVARPASMREVLLGREHRSGLVMALLIGAGSQITGISVFTVYITRIFERVFAGQSQFYSSMYGGIIMAVFKVAGCVPPLFFMRRMRRKAMMLFGLFGAALGNVIMCASFLFQGTARSALAVLATAFYMLTFEFGPGTVTYILYGEVFPESVQNQLVGIAFLAMALTNIVVTFTFPFFEAVQWLAYGLYAVLTLGSGVALLKVLPNK